MSLENIGIGGVLSFNGAEAISGMAAVALAANNLNKSQQGLASGTASLNTSFGMIGGQIQGLGMAMLPFTDAIEASISSAAKFQDVMNSLRSTTATTATAIGQFANEAKMLASSGSAFGAGAIAEGMAELSRAGATTAEVMAGITPVMNNATASNAELGKTAKNTASIVRSFNLEFDQLGHVSDLLAFVGARTSGGMESLADSLKVVGTTSNMLGINLSTTAALMSVMANTGIKGSVAGQGYTQMVERMLKPSKEAAGWLKANNIEMKHFADGSLNVVQALTDITAKIDGYKDVTKRALETQVVFGVRGSKWFNAIRESIVNGRLTELMADIGNNTAGAAERLAHLRMDGFTQQLKSLANTAEVFGIEVGSRFLGPATDSLKMFGNIVSGVTQTLIALENPTADLTKLQQKYGTTIVAVAEGINDGIKGVMAAWAEIKPAILSTISAITGEASPDLIRTLAKWATQLFFVAAAVAPIMVGLGAVAAFIATVLVPAVETMGPVILGIVAAASAMGAVFGVVFAAMSSDGESVGSVLSRVFNVAKEDSAIFINEGLYPIVGAMMGPVYASFSAIEDKVGETTTNMKRDFQEVFGYVVRQSPMMHDAFTIAVSLMTSAIGAFANNAVMDFRIMLAAISPVTTAVKELALWILENLTHAMRTVATAAIKIADTLGLSKGSAGWAAVAGIASQTDDNLDAGTQAGHVGARAGSIAAAQALGKRGPEDENAPQVYQGPGGDSIDALNGNSAAQKTDDQIIRQVGHATKNPNVQVGVAIDDKRKIDISNCMTVDGRSMAVATGKYKQEINERAGFSATPWQRRQILETGATPGGT
jgi:TP901 family phage tail tape measure protein